jgi:hypothetical protein
MTLVTHQIHSQSPLVLVHSGLSCVGGDAGDGGLPLYLPHHSNTSLKKYVSLMCSQQREATVTSVTSVVAKNGLGKCTVEATRPNAASHNVVPRLG